MIARVAGVAAVLALLALVFLAYLRPGFDVGFMAMDLCVSSAGR